MNRTQLSLEEGRPGALVPAEYDGVRVRLVPSSKFSTGPVVDLSVLEAEAVEAERKAELLELGPRSRRVRFHEAWRDDDWGQAGSACGGASAQKVTDDGVKIVPMLCGKWSCPICGWLRYKWFISNLSEAAVEHRLRYFWTLTVPAGACTPAESYDLLMKAWNRLRTQMVRKYGPVQFVWVLEAQKSGYAHLHLLWDVRVDVVWLRSVWSGIIPGAKQVHVEEVQSGSAVKYLAKYLAKEKGRVEQRDRGVDLTGRHRFGKSRGIVFTPYRVKSKGWELLGTPFKEILKWDLRRGAVVSACTRGVPWYWRDGGLGTDAYSAAVLDELGMNPPPIEAEVLRVVRDG